MKSIQRTLTLTLLAINLGLVLAAGATVYLYLRHSLSRQFDALLTAEARRLTGLVQRDENGRLEFSFVKEGTAAGARQRYTVIERSYYEVYDGNGALLVRSHSLGSDRLSAIPPPQWEPTCWTVILPNRHDARATAVRFMPLQEIVPGAATNPSVSATAPSRASSPLILVVAEDRTAMDRTLNILLLSLGVATTVFSIAAAGAVIWSVRRGLKPLAKIAEQTQRIGAASLDFRFPVDGLATEVRPICERLNDLLNRIQNAFEREKRFNADVAHELRTPIAELRSLAEVALKFPEGPPAPEEIYKESLNIAHQMENVVATLLAIARCEAGEQFIQRTPLDFCEIIMEARIPFRSLIRARELNLLSHLPPTAPLTSDRSVLLQLVSNLLSNAATYAPRGSTIDCALKECGADWIFTISNTNETLQASDIEHLFEPFWRKEEARSGGEHAGLGLSLVHSYAKALGGAVTASLSAENIFCVVVSLPQCGK